jgi:hypothetical protein
MRILKSSLLAGLASLVCATGAFAAGTAPSAPDAHVAQQTKTTLSLFLSKPSCDADGDFGFQAPDQFWGYYDFQINGQPYSVMQLYSGQYGTFNCDLYFSQEPGQQYSGLTCGTSYTVRVRAVDKANHKGAFKSVGGSQGAKTLPC